MHRSIIKDRPLFAAGLGLICLGISMPFFVPAESFLIFRDLSECLTREESLYLLIAATKLLALNVIRALPHYLGVFYVLDALDFGKNRKAKLLYLPLAALLILVVYRLIELLYGIEYDLGVPAVILVLFLVLLALVNFDMASPVKKGIMILFLLCTVQCLDVLPLTNGYGFGRGEISEAIKDIAAFMGTEQQLNFFVMTLMSIMFVNVVLYTFLVSDENRIRLAHLRTQQQEQELMNIRLARSEARSQLEIRELVHDLKTPLTAVQTMISTLELGETEENRKYLFVKAEDSVDRMSDLISEFLNEAHFSPVSVQDIIRDLKAQISPMEYAAYVEFELPEEPVIVEVNKIRISRMLVNLIENAWYATVPGDGRILIRAEKLILDGAPVLRLSIRDNGHGMDPKTLELIFESGFSSHGSSGLGLSFVKNVVDTHGGRISVESSPGKGCCFTIDLPAEE